MTARRTVTAAVAVAMFLAVALSAVSASGAGTAVACTLLSPGDLHSTLGLAQSTVLQDWDLSGPVSEYNHSECGWAVWTGTPPATTSARFTFIKQGHAALAAVQTWEPGNGPNASQWKDKDYDELTAKFSKAAAQWPEIFSTKGVKAHSLFPPGYGHEGAAFTTGVPGRGKGLHVAQGCWWEEKSYKAICVFDEEAAFRPVKAHMLTFAKIVVPAFLG